MPMGPWGHWITFLLATETEASQQLP
uniref:Uncharacterized protein n=1 Tax=Arundo donax TaxID=35708 RepID=A0A0A8ZVF7_ARUDO